MGSYMEYEIGFIMCARHIPMLYSLEHEIVHRFIKGLTLPLFFLI